MLRVSIRRSQVAGIRDTHAESSVQMEQSFHVFRQYLNGRLEFVGSTQTIESSRQLVRSKGSGPTERFAIYNLLAHEITYLRADEAVDETSPPNRTHQAR